jgi:hypothetical protein
MACRIARLDTGGNFRRIYDREVGMELQTEPPADAGADPVTITFAVGGTGAQKEMAGNILDGLRSGLTSRKINLNLIAGIREDVYRYFTRLISRKEYDQLPNIRIVYAENLISYFSIFNQVLRNTDILWTKPSELSFYCGLGLPIVMAPGIGPQEEGNREWLLGVGAGLPQKDPRYCGEWLKDWMDEGILAKAAWNGYRNVEKNGTFNILQVVKSLI